MYHYFVFDMDGTLVDTTEGILAGLQRMQQSLPVKQLPPDVLRNFIGPPLKESFMKYYGVRLEETEHMTSVYRDCYMEVGIGKTHVFEGTVAMLRSIRAGGARSAIATLKQHQLASRTLVHTGIDRLVDHIELNLDNSVGDKAAMICRCLDALGCTDKTQALMVGDSPFDGASACAAGVAFLPLTCGDGFRDLAMLDKVPHVAVAHTNLELLELIRHMII